MLLVLGQQPAGSKGHFFALSSCLALPLGLPSLLFQIVSVLLNQPGGRKKPEGAPLLLDPHLDRQRTKGTIGGKKQQPGVLAAGNSARAAPSAAPQHHYRGGK